jgi:hypothetical protein
MRNSTDILSFIKETWTAKYLAAQIGWQQPVSGASSFALKPRAKKKPKAKVSSVHA